MQMVTTMVMIKIDKNDPIWQANKVKMKIPKVFPKIPGLKILENPVPKNPGIPGFGKIPSRKIPGLKFLIPLGPDRQYKAGGLHIGILSLLEYEITQNASLRLIWSHTALEQPLEWLRHQYPQYILTVDSLFPKGVGSLGVSVSQGSPESPNHELYYSHTSGVEVMCKPDLKGS